MAQKRSGEYVAGQTPYYEAVEKALYEMAREGMPNVTYYEVAHRIGRKVTSSLRRAMDQAVGRGIVTRGGFYSEAGGLMAMFVLHPPMKQMNFLTAKQHQEEQTTP